MREDERLPIEKTGLKEIAWFFGLWALGVGTVTLVGMVIKLII